MRKFASAVAALGLAGLISASPANAAATATSWIWSGCGGLTFTTCASVTASVTGSVLSLTISHDAGGVAGTRFKAFGFIGATTGAIGSWTDTGDGAWALNTSISELKVDGIDAKGVDETGGANGLYAGETGVFTFTLTSGTWNLTNATFGIRDIGGPTEQCSSNKLYINSDYQSVDNKGDAVGDPALGDCSSTVVPEPATMALLATGLVGLGGAGLIRRRKSA